jgi:hypothetical protein
MMPTTRETAAATRRMMRVVSLKDSMKRRHHDLAGL